MGNGRIIFSSSPPISERSHDRNILPPLTTPKFLRNQPSVSFQGLSFSRQLITYIYILFQRSFYSSIARPSPENPSWDTLIPAKRFANLSFCEISHSFSLQFIAYSIPAINVSPAPIGLQLCVLAVLHLIQGYGNNSLDHLKIIFRVRWSMHELPCSWFKSASTIFPPCTAE